MINIQEFKKRINERLETKALRQEIKFQPRYDQIFHEGVDALNKRSDDFLEFIDTVRMD